MAASVFRTPGLQFQHKTAVFVKERATSVWPVEGMCPSSLQVDTIAGVNIPSVTSYYTRVPMATGVRLPTVTACPSELRSLLSHPRLLRRSLFRLSGSAVSSDTCRNSLPDNVATQSQGRSISAAHF